MMASAFAAFSRACQELAPRSAVVLGSGLGGVDAHFRETASIPFADVPGLVPPTVHGHNGRLAVGLWQSSPVLLCRGRLHFYEGHPREVVTGVACIAATLGVKQLLLTNAAGGIHPSLDPGSLMAIRSHITLVGPAAWRTLAAGCGLRSPYSQRLLDQVPELLTGVYAALTGPCYETPAEIRALTASGADAVGMSTAMEAETATELGMEVLGISCVTNRAAGLTATTLDHSEVLVNAKLAVKRLAEILGRLIAMNERPNP